MSSGATWWYTYTDVEDTVSKRGRNELSRLFYVYELTNTDQLDYVLLCNFGERRGELSVFSVFGQGC